VTESPPVCSHCGRFIAENEPLCEAQLDAGPVVGPLHLDCAEQVDAELAQAFRALIAQGRAQRD